MSTTDGIGGIGEVGGIDGSGGAVVFYALGGTISMAGTGDGGAGAVVARLTGSELAANLPGLAESGVRLRVEDVERVPSADLSFAGLLDLAARARAAVDGGAAGVVVSQGTDTLEESAYLLDLVWDRDAPLVATGAMRNPTLAGPDGPANLLAALRTAASPHARGLGVLVAFNDELHAARSVRKTHATSTAAFRSPNTGPLGHIEEERVRILTRPPRRAALVQPGPDALAGVRVGLHTAVLEDDGADLAVLGRSWDGLVVAGFGVGHVAGYLVPALEELAARIPVVLVSRTGAGPVLRHTYGAPGSETDLQSRGLINGGLLDPYKARVLLRLLLAGGVGREQVAAAFAEHG